MNVYELIQKQITDLPRTQSRTIQRLQHLGVHTFFDLLHHIPHRYEDYTIQYDPKTYNPDTIYTATGDVMDIKQTYTRTRKTMQKALIQTEGGEIEAVWFNQSYVLKMLRSEQKISMGGKISHRGRRPVLQVQSFELLDGEREPLHTGRLVPIYPETYGITSKTIREKVSSVLDKMHESPADSDILPPDILTYHDLLSLKDALHMIHFPSSFEEVAQAKKRLAFNELFIAQMRSFYIRRQWEREHSVVTSDTSFRDRLQKEYEHYITHLPFSLTSAQEQCLADIMADMSQQKPMNRFIQGDVGSGKTLVAIISAYLMHQLGYRSLIMAPTEVLAEQHMRSFCKLLSPYSVRIGLHTSSKKIKKQEEYDVLIGTHALFSRSLEIDHVGLVVIDEQHRFGVQQRALLRKKGGKPHVLTMTATPIPRTMTLTLYGDLDVSELYEKPQGRVPIKTYVVEEKKRHAAYDWVKKEIQQNGSQVFIICPFIQESEDETMKSVRAATKEYEFLQQNIFPDFSLALLHGKQKSSEKEQIMRDFQEKEYQILVSTSVVEVGIDIPNATIMIIEGAERYGLAQLHQLRGRVGRGEKQSYCLLFTSSFAKGQSERLQFFAQNTRGIDLAEYDLKRRGPGSMYGVEQHGRTMFKHTDFHTVPFIHTVKKSVTYFDQSYALSDYPFLEKIRDESLQSLIARD